MKILIKRIIETQRERTDTSKAGLDYLIDEIGRLALVVDRSKRIISRFEKLVQTASDAYRNELYDRLIMARELVENLEKRLDTIMTDINVKKKKAFKSAKRQLEQPIDVLNSSTGLRSVRLDGIKACSELLESIFAELLADFQKALPNTYSLPIPNPRMLDCHNE